MMRVIFLLLVSSIALQSKSQTWNNYLQKRFKSYGIWADSVLWLPSDTTINKAAKSLAVKNGNLYIANGTYWTEISGGSSGGISKTYADWGLSNVNDSTLKVDSSLIATRAGLYKVSDSISDKLNNKLNASAVSIGAGQVAFGSGTNTIGGDNGLYWDNTNKRLGIGNTTPGVSLDIAKDFAANDGLRLLDASGGYFQVTQSTTTAGSFQPVFQGLAKGNGMSALIFKALQTTGTAPANGTVRFIARNSTDTAAINATDIAFRFDNNNTAALSILGNGNVGIGTTTPSEKLHVVGNGLFTGTVKVGAYTLPSTDGSANQVLKTNGSGVLTWQNDSGISLTSLSATTPLSYNNGTGAFSISQANGSTNGYLSSTDWNTFNNKISSSHTVNNIANGTGFLKNNGSGTWSWDNNSYVDLTSNQTIKGYKTFDTSFTMRHYTDSLKIYDTTRGIVLENTKGATGNSNSVTPEGDRITPLIRFKNNVWLNYVNPNAPDNVIPNASNPTEWVIQQRNYSGSQYSYNSNLEFKYKIGTRDYVTVGKFTKDGFVGNISGLLNVTVGGLAAGGQGYFNIKQANTEDVRLTMGTSGSNSYIMNSSSSGIQFTSGTSTIIGSGNIYGVLVKDVGWNTYKVLVGGGDEFSTTPASYFNVKGNAYIGGNDNAPSNGLQVAGKTILTGLATNYIYINDSSYTLTTTKKQINVAATTKNVYINLLTSVGNDGQEWSVRRISDTNQYKVIIKPTSGQKINGADSLILFAQNNNVTLKSDGANYIIVDRYNTAKANTPAAAEDLTNISSVTPKKRIYTQTDSVVSVTEYYEVTLTTAGTASSFAVKTPIPTTFTSVYDAIGVGAVTIVDDFTSPTTRKSASAVITSVNSSNKVLVQLNDDADSGNTKRIVTLNYQYILK